MPSSTLTSKGQITLPKEIRESLSLGPGDRVAFRLREDGVVEMLPETVDVMDLCGVFKPKVRGVTVEAMNEAIRKAASRR
ncbi:MAG TPA: type II toxin-antitoxin system PrlF family antitoxin [Thermoanaerobaculia bacterium]|nr:type II toxin-antitoxin system PrlF family antitoxin [Thermoanaerobaculia bacterium]